MPKNHHSLFALMMRDTDFFGVCLPKKKGGRIAALERESGAECDLSNVSMPGISGPRDAAWARSDGDARVSSLFAFGLPVTYKFPSTLHCTKNDPTHFRLQTAN